MADGFEHLEFIVYIQAITGLDLGCGGAVSQHSIETPSALGYQLRQRSGPRGSHRAHDPPTGGHDLHVSSTPEARFELVLAGAGENQVGVRVNETGHDYPVRGVNHLIRFSLSQHLLGCSDQSDESTAYGHCSIFDEAQLIHSFSPPGTGGCNRDGRGRFDLAQRAKGEKLAGAVDY